MIPQTLTLVLLLASVALQASAAAPAAAPAASTSTVESGQDRSGEMGKDSTPKESFDDIYKKDLKTLEADLKDAIQFITSRFTRESEMEQVQHEKKLAFRKAEKDAGIAFEKQAFESWKTIMKRMREIEPISAAREKAAFDEKASEDRRKFNEEGMAKSRAFME
ncbi:MAG: hypothetical protein ABL955_08090, partial [Elusimicrobiota bacterium]